MAQLGFFVSPEDVVERNFDDSTNTPVPAGWYEAEIKNAEIKETKAGGHRINVRYDITGPTHAGRVVFGSINIHHQSNPQVEEIGKQQLALIAGALGKRIGDTDDLIGGQLRIKVRVNKSDQYGDSNDVHGWSKSSSALPSGAPQSAPAASGSTPPWLKK